MTNLGDENNSLIQHNNHGLSPSQFKFLNDMPIWLVMKSYEQFSTWLEVELYNFYYLNIVFKSHLQPEDEKRLQDIPNQWKGRSCQMEFCLHTM